MNLEQNVKLTIVWTLLTASAGLAACASGPPDRTSIDARAFGARTAAEHQAIASEYQALAEREAEASLRHQIRGREEERIAAFVNEGKGIRGHPSIMVIQWQMRAMVEARAAEDAKALAKQHRGLAAGSEQGESNRPSR